MGSSGRSKSVGNRVIDIEDFGPVTIRPLSRREYEQIQSEAGGDLDVQLALMIQRAVVAPEFTELGRLEGRDEDIDVLGNAVVNLTREAIL
jgi:hypothetical protein